MGRPKPQPLPFDNRSNATSTNTFGYMSPSRDDPNVQAYLDAPLDPDPGASRRGQLAEQDLENRWNNAFTAGIPQQVRMMMEGSERRKLGEQTGADMRQARYQANLGNLARQERLLPQLVQTGGTQSGMSSGFQSVPGQQGFWGQLGQSLLGGAIGGGLGFI